MAGILTFSGFAFVADFGTRNFNLKTKFNMENKTSTNHENSNDANRLLAEVLITKLQERLKLFPDEDDVGLYDRGLYDGYLNSLKIVTEECAKHFR
jgi:hypothetical protein